MRALRLFSTSVVELSEQQMGATIPLLQVPGRMTALNGLIFEALHLMDCSAAILADVASAIRVNNAQLASHRVSA
jgi:hypothetical protein